MKSINYICHIGERDAESRVSLSVKGNVASDAETVSQG